MILVKVQYKEQIWYDLQEITVEQIHGKIRHSTESAGKDTTREDPEADSLRA